MTPAEKRVEDLRAKLKQEEAKLAKQQAAARARESKSTKKIEDQKKILIGAMVFESMKRNETTHQNIMGKLDAFLTRPTERALFGLAEKAAAVPVVDKLAA
jgi:hypothetical protein